MIEREPRTERHIPALRQVPDPLRKAGDRISTVLRLREQILGRERGRRPLVGIDRENPVVRGLRNGDTLALLGTGPGSPGTVTVGSLTGSSGTTVDTGSVGTQAVKP